MLRWDASRFLYEVDVVGEPGVRIFLGTLWTAPDIKWTARLDQLDLTMLGTDCDDFEPSYDAMQMGTVHKTTSCYRRLTLTPQMRRGDVVPAGVVEAPVVLAVDGSRRAVLVAGHGGRN